MSAIAVPPPTRDLDQGLRNIAEYGLTHRARGAGRRSPEAGQFASDEALVLLGYRTEGLVHGASPA